MTTLQSLLGALAGSGVVASGRAAGLASLEPVVADVLGSTQEAPCNPAH